MQCPHCPETFLTMSERQGIEIDYCPKCRGIWLDRGELDKLIEKSRPETPTKQSKESVQIAHGTIYKDDYYKVKKRKSFLEELFD